MRLFAHRTFVQAARLHYAQPHRGYHDAGHLDELILLAHQHAPDLDESEQLAILFHDAVYVPGAARGENERLSARLMEATIATLEREQAGTAVSTDDLARAARIVEATAHAEQPPDEAARVCDLDSWRLASPWEEFQRHARGIHHEYLHLSGSEDAFWTARHAFYRSMLAKLRIFATAGFRARFEAAARANMERALRER